MDFETSEKRDQNDLIRLIREVSYREGDFTLVSGKKSKFYIDLKATTLHPWGATLIGRMITRALLKSGVKVDAVGGLTLGADPIATAVSMKAFESGVNWPAFLVRKESKSHGTSRYIEGVENLKPQAMLVCLEDVVTTGGSSLKAVERMRAQGYFCETVVTVVDRLQGGRDVLKKAGLNLITLATIEEIQAFQ